MTYKSAIIGAGARKNNSSSAHQGFSIGTAHANAYLELGISVEAIADVSIANAEALAAHVGGAGIFDSYTDMLHSGTFDIVSICTWPTLHAEMVVEAASAGVPAILVEKPMAVSLSEVDRMIDAARGSGSRLFVNHQRRFEQPYIGAFDFIQDGNLGELKSVEAFAGGGWDLMSWGSHWVDMARYLVGDPASTWVLGAMQSSGQIRYGHRVEDQGLIQFDIGRGRIATVYTGNQIDEIGIVVRGENAILELSADGAIGLYSRTADLLSLREQYWSDHRPDGIAAAISDALRATADGSQSRIDATLGAATTEIMLGGFKSASQGGRINLPIADRNFSIRE